MATVKKPVKKPVKKVVEKKPATTEDLVLGNTPVEIVKSVIPYEDASITYKVTNLKNNNVLECDGTLIETFIGSNNIVAREELKAGARVVITKDFNKNDEYKIEVID